MMLPLGLQGFCFFFYLFAIFHPNISFQTLHGKMHFSVLADILTEYENLER